MHGPSMPESMSRTIEQPLQVEGERYDHAQDNLARMIVFFGPYVLWGSLGGLVGMLFLLSG